MKTTLTYTNKFNKNMIPCIYKGSCYWTFIFVDMKNNTFFKSEAATIAWLKRMNISQGEFTDKCWDTYDMLKDAEIEHALVSFFTKDDAKVYNYAANIDLKEMSKFM